MKIRLIQLVLLLLCVGPLELSAYSFSNRLVAEDYPINQPKNLDLAPKLIVSRSNFTPASNPKPGQVIKLLMELTNSGNAVSANIKGKFILPVGVQAQGSTSVAIPAIRPGEKQMISFYFKYLPSYNSKNIAVVFETVAAPGMSAIKKTMFLGLSQTERSVGRNSQNEIFWVTPDPDEHKAAEKTVDQDKVDVKVMTLGDGALAKKDFSIRVNGRRAQGQKMDGSFLSPPRFVQGRNQQTFSTQLKLKEGRNEVQIVYYEEDGKTIKSKSKTFVFNYVPAVKPNLYVLSVGVTTQDGILGAKDARDFTKVFRSLPESDRSRFESVQIQECVVKQETNRLSIAKAIGKLQQTVLQPNDLVLVFISMDANWSEEDKYLLLPSDFDPDYASITALELETDILQQLNEVNGKKFLFLNTAPGLGPQLVTTGSVLQSVQFSQGIEIHAACQSQSTAGEYQKWGNSAFTKAVLEAFRNKKVTMGGKEIQADGYKGANAQVAIGDGAISVEEIGHFLKDRMKYLKKGKEKVEYIHKPAYLIDREKVIFRPK